MNIQLKVPHSEGVEKELLGNMGGNKETTSSSIIAILVAIN